jgi:signal peptidase I
VFVNKFIYGPSTPQIIPFINMSLPYYKLPPLSPPEQGDVIVFIFPGNRDQDKAENFEYYLKRCIAVAGDTLHIRGGRTYVNGVEYGLPAEGQFANWPPEYRQARWEEDRYLTFPPGRGYTRDDYGPIRIPAKGDVITLNQQNIGEWSTFIRREGHLVDEVNIRIDGEPVSQYVVERDYVFGMGDNRDNSLDSRYWGFIPEAAVVGTPMIVYWSWQNVDEIATRTAQMQGYHGQVEYPVSEKIKRVRWSRLGTIIR